MTEMEMILKAKFIRTIAGAGFLALATATQPFAQTSEGGIARLTELKGNVLVSRDSGLASANDRARIGPGTRIITTANSRVVIEFDNGCKVTLEENQRF